MENMDIYNAVKAVPESAQKQIIGGRLKGKTDINPMWRIKVLTEQFGACGIGWYYDVNKEWLESGGEETAAFVSISLYVKVDGEWSKPIHGIGGSMFVSKEKTGIYVSDECYKMATTDAISVACKQLGIGADVYWDADKTKYSKDEVQEEIEKKFEPVIAELKRTGYGKQSIYKTYKVNAITELSDLQIKDFLQKMKNVPDKES